MIQYLLYFTIVITISCPIDFIFCLDGAIRGRDPTTYFRKSLMVSVLSSVIPCILMVTGNSDVLSAIIYVVNVLSITIAVITYTAIYGANNQGWTGD